MANSTLQNNEITELRQQSHTTRRAVSPALEEILYTPIPVLDHGFIRVVDYMGDDAGIVQAARVSYGKGTKKISEDRGLIRYLMRHRHTSPFEMCEIKLHVKMPIFVARQWIRHRTANVNEYSGRYSILDREFYLPAPEHLAAQSQSNRQGRAETITGARASHILEMLKSDALTSYDHYLDMMNLDSEDGSPTSEEPGLARELARMNLPVNYYTQWYWKVDLHNLLHFIKLRADRHAQYEIRVYADQLLNIVQKWVPLTAEAFIDYRMEASELSRGALAAIKAMLRGQPVTPESTGLSKGEWQELMHTLENPPITQAA